MSLDISQLSRFITLYLAKKFNMIQVLIMYKRLFIYTDVLILGGSTELTEETSCSHVCQPNYNPTFIQI